ncbi:YniB family protein [Aggregatibacter actinomycetemcomitans]|uniref:YniB family protein n=1 Tax=Aggregatibacter actinomycetemcomitans TaxID=714 RepID=UPI00197CA2EE|nr:YniB family protein [Aggregatibacter actinomycetemcomitans]MBN6063500.1 hypothetical protein [Aggregatibacter actinomycetemcomitans]MBN6081121.1 hypothetical protein [Aggregatibacter actinomycetemcomitans]MBN6083373.1 hypothetical protein [Aggregatibacter actinomycetemcomitans]
MNLSKEKNKARCKIIIGFLGGLICLMLLAMSYLKMMYFLPNIGILFRPIKKLIYLIYSKTLFLEPLWRLAPVPDINDLLSGGFISVIAISTVFVLFMILRNSAMLRLKKLKDIEQEIDNQLIKESIKGELARNKKEIEKSIKIPEQSFLSSFHSLYIAPLIIGVILIFLEKWL